MSRQIGLGLWVLVIGCPTLAWSDAVLDWNATIVNVVQSDGANVMNRANPGWSTRAMAMLNGAIYDVSQALNRTHVPFLVDVSASPLITSRDAAIHQAAFEILSHTYPGESALITADYNARMALIPNGLDKANGIALGQHVAQNYITNRANDNSDRMVPYTPLPGPGFWRPDPWHPGQQAWGPEWGMVRPFAIPNTTSFVNALPPIPALNSPEYTAAFHQVRDYGDLHSTVRTPVQTEIGLFWAYDRPTMGPPPVLFIKNLMDVAQQTGNSSEQNARMFAMASVAQADSMIASWDTKFRFHFWRPVTAIQEADTDGNPDTIAIPNWRPLGAPGPNPNDFQDDFTPPFPAWTSGHATMGSAVFKSLQNYFGTNVFDEIDGLIGNDELYTLSSQEEGSGFTRSYRTFTQTAFLDIGTEDSPEGENSISRIYLGIHWIFDQRDGMTLGRDIADYIAANHFQPVPEPLASLPLLTILLYAAFRRNHGASAAA